MTTVIIICVALALVFLGYAFFQRRRRAAGAQPGLDTRTVVSWVQTHFPPESQFEAARLAAILVANTGLELKDLRPETALGGDPKALARMLDRVEVRCKVTLPEERRPAIRSVGDLVAAVVAGK